MLAFNLLNRSKFTIKSSLNIAKSLKVSKLLYRNFFTINRAVTSNSPVTKSITKFSLISKKFSESADQSSQRSERTFYFTEQEAYSMNEHDRMILQLDSSSVPLTTLPKFMKELAEYCYVLSKYKEYTKGWKYLGNFFYSNLSNFTNEDFKFYSQIFAYTLFKGTKEDFWEKISEEFSRRNWDKESFLDLINCFNLSQVKSHAFWKSIVEKSRNYTIDTFQENCMIAAILGNVQYTADDAIWEQLLSKLELEEIKEGTFDLAVVINAANSIKEKLPERKTELYEKIRKHVEENFNTFSPDALYSIFGEYLKLFDLNGEEVSRYVIQIADKIGLANDYIRFGFIHQLLLLCKRFPEIIPTLTQNRHILPNNFVVPTEEMVHNYSDAISQTMMSDIDKGAVSFNQFWEKYSESFGINVDFAKDMFVTGVANYNAISEIFTNTYKPEI
jgi:hypothetical protein